MNDLYLELRPLPNEMAEIVLCGMVSVDGRHVDVFMNGTMEAMRQTIAASAEELQLTWYDRAVL